MSPLRPCLLVALVVAGSASADPAPVASPAPAPAPATDPPPLVLSPLLLFDPTPPPPPPSLRLEAARVAAQHFAEEWRLPEPGSVIGVARGTLFIGYGAYRPRSGRSAALHAGSVASTILGEILLTADSPLAGVGAMLTGATLDAASADADRDAEARGR